MEIPWFMILISISICTTLLFALLKSPKNLPPGPLSVPIISDLLLLLKSLSQIESILKKLKAKYGPIVTLRSGRRPSIFITTSALAYEALIQNGAIFADRPRLALTSRLFSANQSNITLSSYGPTWRFLRRNLTSEILHPSRVRSYSNARKWVLDILINRLKSNSNANSGDNINNTNVQAVKVTDHFRYTMFCLLVLMCFGDKLEEEQIQEIERMQHQVLMVLAGKFNILNLWPRMAKIVFRKRWEQLLDIAKVQERVLVPLIRAREKLKHDNQVNKNEYISSYVDTLLDLELPEEKRKLEVKEIVALCSEFLDAGTDTTSTAMEWIMANIVKYPDIQEKLYMEIKEVIISNGEDKEEEEIKEEELEKMPYLKAVILEGLRRHPPAHFLLPHAVSEDVSLEGYLVPKNAVLNFMVADINWDSKTWKDPMEFKPERFLKNSHEVVDITGTRGIKMMPFGAGRRICPGYSLAMLHLEYFVANLVWNFKWTAVDGDHINLSEKQDFTIVMKYPLQAHISSRLHT